MPLRLGYNGKYRVHYLVTRGFDPHQTSMDIWCRNPEAARKRVTNFETTRYPEAKIVFGEVVVLVPPDKSELLGPLEDD